MVYEHFPDLFEIEYSFKEGGHNSLKFIDGRFFFFSEADSHLTEKNEYLTMVKLPESSALELFWDELDTLGIWNWEGFSKIEESNSNGKCEHDEHEHCNHEHHDAEIYSEDILTEREIPEGENLSDEEIPGEGNIWQLKIINGQNQVYIKSWCLEGESGDEFFKSLKKMFGIDITLPFTILSGKLSDKKLN